MDSSILQIHVRDILKTGTNELQISFKVENIVGKGENAGHHHFLLFPQYFHKTSTMGLFGKGSIYRQ